MVLAAILSILRIIGIVLLVILIVILVLLLLVLFVPIHYRAKGSLADPGTDNRNTQNDDDKGIPDTRDDGQGIPDARGDAREISETGDNTQRILETGDDSLSLERIRDSLEGEFSFSWLLHLISGHISYPDDPQFTVRILFFHLNIGDLLRKLTSKGDKQEDQKDKEEKKEEDNSLEGRIKTVLDKADKAYQTISYFWNYIQKSRSQRAIDKLKTTLGTVLGKLAPRKWKISGTAGLGDPEYTAMVLEAEGILYPVAAGHLDVKPDFDGCELILTGYAKGHICIFTVGKAALGLLLDKDVRRFVKGLRKGPPKSAGKTADGNEKIKGKTGSAG